MDGEEHAGFGIQKFRSKGRVVLTLSGELDLSTAPLLREKLVDIVQDGADEIVLDMEHVDFIDSVGLSLVIAQHKRMVQSGGRLVIQSPTPRSLHLFEVSGLSSVLTISPAAVAD